MRPRDTLRHWPSRVLAAGTGLWGVSALGGGYAMATAPDGSALRFEAEWLRDTPFPDYRVPGLLLGATGVASTVSAALLWGGASGRRTARPTPGWQRSYVQAVALAQCGWMAGEILAMGSAVRHMDASTARFFHAFWWGYGAFSVLNLGLTVVPDVRRTLGA